MMNKPSRRASQQGMFLIEALVSIMLFAIGILGIVGLSAYAISAQSDAQYRTEAATLANRIAQEAWLNVDRYTGADPGTRAASLRATLATFRHQTTGEDCAFSGEASPNAVVSQWREAAQRLPGATETMQQIRVDTDAAGYNKLTVAVCWQVPADPVPRRHVLATFVN